MQTTKEESFNEIFAEAVDAAFSSLGDSAKHAVYWYITQKAGIEKNELASHVETLTPALEGFFQGGSSIIEMMILQNLSSRTGVVLTQEQCDKFPDAVRLFSKAYRKGPRSEGRVS
jgi:hypothetical protein